ncbi:hypothetical protein [Streptomyces goshikiensis]|uniref:hypothetical protein n=1 Tax=Streptomyces goshikiensis TaxID=1942 RepID=UPI002E0EA9D8|nr:hypothetical protein OG224_06585 [Streptomyces goshikiensis]
MSEEQRRELIARMGGDVVNTERPTESLAEKSARLHSESPLVLRERSTEGKIRYASQKLVQIHDDLIGTASRDHRGELIGLALHLDRAADAVKTQQSLGDEAWGTVWLHSKWRYITSQMTTPERELAADAVARWSAALNAHDGEPTTGEPEGLRWWREA